MQEAISNFSALEQKMPASLTEARNELNFFAENKMKNVTIFNDQGFRKIVDSLAIKFQIKALNVIPEAQLVSNDSKDISKYHSNSQAVLFKGLDDRVYCVWLTYEVSLLPWSQNNMAVCLHHQIIDYRAPKDADWWKKYLEKTNS